VRHLRLLFWLRWKYLWRSTVSRRLAVVLGLVGGFVVSGMLGFMVFLLLDKARRTGAESAIFSEGVTLGFAVLYAGWLYFSSLSELFDPQRLVPYPIRPRTIFLGSCAASAVGQVPIYAAGLFAGIAMGWPAGAAAQAGRAGLFVLFVVHLVMLSRLLRLTFLQILSSRRWREIAMILGALAGAGFMLLQLALTSFRGDRQEVAGAVKWVEEAARSGLFSTWLCWLPSTWLSHAFELSGPSAWAWAGGFAASTALIAVLGGKAEERLAFSEPVFAYVPKKRKVAGESPRFLRGVIAWFGRWIGDDVAGVARKEAAVLFRDPTVRSRLISSLFYMAMLFAFPLLGGRTKIFASPGAAGFAMLGFVELLFFLNIFGLDGTALRTVALLPVDRRRMIAGKNLCLLTVFLPLNFIVITAFAIAFSRKTVGDESVMDLSLLPWDFAMHTAAFFVLLAAGSLFSVFFPMRMIAPGQRINRMDDDGGCVRALLRTAAFMAVGIPLAPVAFARIAMSEMGWGAAVNAAMAAGTVVYAGAVYGLGLWLAGKAFASREEKMIEFFAKT
jgi:ABC-2 type transport system permease protein